MRTQLLRLRIGLLDRGGGGSKLLINAIYLAGQQSRRTIVTKDQLYLPDDYPEAWPYKEVGYHHWDMWKDRTNKRLHENSKLIVVEGNIGAGKSTVAPKLADALGFHYMPEFSMDHILVDRYGLDMRDYYHLFPKRFRIPDIKMFYQNPYDDLTAVMQDRIFYCRHEQYCNALAHIYNTGQGVVLERPVHSDFVFVNAMRKKNFIGFEYFRHYYFVRKNAIPPLKLWPHLVVYLDCPVDKCLENIRSRGNVDEMNVVDREYLQTLEDSYKDALREYRKHSKVLVYDWSTPGTADMIVENIEEINFDFFDYHQSDLYLEWFSHKEEWWATKLRNYFTEKIYPHLESFDGINHHEVGELYIHPTEGNHFKQVMMHEVLKDRCTYGMTHRDPPETRAKVKWMWKYGQSVPEKWCEYFFHEAYYACITNGAYDRWDPMAVGYDPDFLHRHG